MGRDELKDYVGLSPPHAHLEKGAMVAGITIDDKLEGEALYNRTDIYNSDNDYNKIQMLRRRQRRRSEQARSIGLTYPSVLSLSDWFGL